jgi:ribulose-phosphate 3-epimerase
VLVQRLREAVPAVLPSLLQCDFGNLQREVDRLQAAGVKGLHLDVMDGQFVPNLTYGMPIVAALRRLTPLPLDVHLMIGAPDRYIEAFAKAGADLLTVHIEALTQPAATLAEIRRYGIGVGLAINPKTPLSMIEPWIDRCDLVLVMSVEAGFGGQSFDPHALDRLRQVRRLRDAAGRTDLLIEVDGGVNRQTIADCRAAGADLFVVGSALFGSSDYRTAVNELNLLIDSQSSTLG